MQQIYYFVTNCDWIYFPSQKFLTDLFFCRKLRRNFLSVTNFCDGFNFSSQFATEFSFRHKFCCKLRRTKCRPSQICDGRHCPSQIGTEWFVPSQMATDPNIPSHPSQFAMDFYVRHKFVVCRKFRTGKIPCKYTICTRKKK